MQDKVAAAIEGVVGFGLIALATAAVAIGRRVVLERRWNFAKGRAPGAGYDLIATGEHRDESTTALTLGRVALFLGRDDVAAVALGDGVDLKRSRSIPLSRIESVDVQQLDSSLAWATIPGLTIRDEGSLSIELDGWRLGSRRRLFASASRAAEKIRSRMMGA